MVGSTALGETAFQASSGLPNGRTAGECSHSDFAHRRYSARYGIATFIPARFGSSAGALPPAVWTRWTYATRAKRPGLACAAFTFRRSQGMPEGSKALLLFDVRNPTDDIAKRIGALAAALGVEVESFRY
jgi:hypothetical protein